MARKGHIGRKGQAALDFDATGERREANSLVNDIRREVELWRGRGYPGATAISRKLVQHWAGVKTIYDMSATPFYLAGWGHQEGYIFPWVAATSR